MKSFPVSPLPFGLPVRHSRAAALYTCLLLCSSLLGISCGVRPLANNEATPERTGEEETYVNAPLPISGLMTVFGDDLSQWDVFDYDGERAGELKLRFPPVAGRGGDFTQWTFRMQGVSGSIRPKFSGRDDQWEVRVGDDVVTIRTVFPRQYDQWAIGDGRTRVVFAVKDFNLLEFWGTRTPGGPGLYQVYTRFEGDPRDWEIAEALQRPISPATQLAMVWLPVYMRLSAGLR